MKAIPIENAGIVILNNMIPKLFEQLKLLDKNGLLSGRNNQRAVYYLHCLSGIQSLPVGNTPLLNKLLCGAVAEDKTSDSFKINIKEQALLEDCIKNIIANWPSMEHSSVNSFKINWIMRKGLLTELDKQWQLTIEKKPYDILLAQYPFNLQNIYYVWMDKPLIISWTY